MVKDLEADSSYKPNSLEVLVTKAYKAMSLAPIPDSLESNESLLRECYKALAEAGHDAHVVCLMLCRILAQSLDMRGRTTEASRYYERARQGTKDTFGNDHANTFIINAIQSSLYIRQGRIEEAEDIARETLNGLSRLIGKDSIGLVPALGELMAILATQGKVSEAAEVNERTRTILLTKFHENDPTLYPVRSAEIDILLEQERYDEATNKLSILLAELASLLGINLHGELPRLKIPLGPQDIGSPPAVAMLYGSYAAYATALHAQGLPSAEDYMLKVMLAAYRNFDSESWTNLSPTGGWGGSALCTAMEQDLCPYLELLLCLGMKNKQDGSHYAQAISIAQRENLPKIEALLEEHQLLCYGALTSIPFKDCESLGVFINGDWTGSYMYADGGPRKDPKGKRTVTISATLSDGKYDSVAIEGTAQDDMGSWIVTGEGQVSGDLVLFFYPEESSPEHAWEYRGRVNVQRNAMGGAWGIRGLLDTRPGGTFFYFKS
jgi:tetratricopeptide (TPR) repeat protein